MLSVQVKLNTAKSLSLANVFFFELFYRWAAPKGRGYEFKATTVSVEGRSKQACPSGTYKPEASPGGISTCIPCPDENHTSRPGSTSPEDCVCREGYQTSGQTCHVRTCPHLRQPKHGHISCSTVEMSYNTLCLVTCNEGYRLEGSAKLTCQGNAQWDGAEPRCVERHCATFQKPKGVLISPPSCGKQPAKPGLICQLSCRPGYVLSGAREVSCATSGKWSAKVQTAVCKDVEAPQISCPKDIETKTGEQQDSANITWQIPTAKDNSGEKVPVHVHPAFTPPYLFPIGEVAITYTATDSSGNQASCTFHVRVIDVEPPVIDWCRSPPPIQVLEKEHSASWDEPQFSDNSGAELVITRSHTQGDLFPHGETIVWYTATDPSGNNRTCDIHIVIKGSPCEVPFTPINGDFVCAQDSAGVNCTLSCREGYDFTEGSMEKYYCAFEDGVWRPPYSTEWPDCAIKRFANHGFKSFEMLYKTTRCDDMDLLKKFSAAFETTLGKMVPSFCSDAGDIDCRLEDLTKKYCIEYNYDYENGFAIGPGGWGAGNRLDYSYDHFLDVVQETPPGVGKARSARIKRSAPSSDPKIQLIFNITVNCPLGTYYSLEHSTCESCLMGSYQDEEGQLECKLCPPRTHTEYLHSRSISECKAQCKQGTYSSSGLETLGEFSRSGLTPCYPCPRDYYQPNAGKSFCLACPFYGTTTITGATSITDCSSVHCETDINECQSSPCLNNAVCKDQVGGFLCKCPPGFLGTRCEKNVDECLSHPCQNGATCKDGANSYRCQCPAGFTGPHCELNINECQSNPCKNQATCVDELNAYSCKCRPGFSGHRCETEQPSGFNLDFEVSGIYGYVILDGVLPSLPAITCAFWMRSSDVINYGTPISYALDGDKDNTFLLTDYNGWVLYVNGKEKITNCPSVNDGSWHHIAITWTSTGGVWRVYIDGKLSDSGTGLSIGKAIPGGGALVLGQEQDKKGEGFNPAESFVGSISQLNLWDYVLSPQQVKSLASSCPEELSRGNVLAWPDFLSGITGKVKVDSRSIFCSDCPSLEGTIPHLRTASGDRKPGSKVSLFCDPGFQIVGNPVQYCLNQGQWTQPLPHCERIRCGLPPALENGFYSAEDFHAGSTVTYQCNNGYYLLGDSRMFCTDNGSWNGISPSCLDVDECAVGSDCNEHASCLNTNGSYICSCDPPYTGDGKNCAEPVKCKAPENPENGHSSGEIYTVGAEVTFSCEEGYQLLGVSKVTCLESGEWDHVRPSCEAISCGAPPAPENGGVVGSVFTFGSKVTYRCDKGYTLAGDEETACLASGSWSHSFPVCELVKCPSPETIDNGKYILSGLTYLSIASYSCENGYSLQGPALLECTASGRWDRPPPTCHLVSCGEPPVLKDAVITGTNFTFGNLVTYTCKEGFTLAGPDTIICLANGKWNSSNPQCLAVSCDEPPTVDHASPETAHRLFGDTAFYYCADGYSLADNSQLICNAQGKWVPPEGQAVPRCIAHFCENPPSVSYSILESVSKAKFAAGSVVSFKCLEGFVLNTSAKIECLRGGEWRPSPLSIQCIPVRCGEPPSIVNGYASGANYSFGAVVAYSCHKGFYIKGEKKSTCEATGQWSRPMPTCHPVSCSEPPKVENGFLEHATGRTFESEARFQCNPGYKAAGSPVFVCQANRHWHSEAPLSCTPLNCGKPPPIQNGFMKGESFDLGSKVQFFCNEGYELVGDNSWTCQKSGKWSKKPNPKCVPTKCPEPPLLENQLVLKELTSEVGVMTISCKEGHALQGPSVLKCMPSGQWNGSFPVCKMVLCPSPPLIPFSLPASGVLHFGSAVKYSCVDGFFLRGDPTILCQADGTWSSPLPECVPVECPQPEELLNGIIHVQGLAYLSTTFYTCKPGFELVGNATTLCGENGQWLGGKPVCKPVECPEPKEILNGQFSYISFQYGQTITYFCDRGFRLEGPKALTCLETGDWDMDAPSCLAIHCSDPQPIENGFVEGADYRYGAMIIYSCFPGFQVAGHAMQTCEESGWSSSSPTCVPIDCGLPPHIDFGDCTKVKDGQEYFDQEDDMMEVPYLTPRPQQLKTTAKTPAAHASHFLYGTMVSYSCDPGYELLGNPVLICQEDGTWNGSAPSCISIECDLPVAPENGFLHFTQTTMGSAVQYSCKPGHVLEGSHLRLCLQNKKWSGAAPHCEAVSCSKPNPVRNGLVKGSDYSYLAVLRYECDPGYVLNGTETRICRENKAWDGHEPTCVPVDCGSPPVPNNGQVKGEFTFQKEVTYSCSEGFILEGARSRVCLTNGSWSGSIPSCTPVRCTAPPQVANGVTDGVDYGYKKEVAFRCLEGYVLHGAPKLTCQADGTWDAEVPVCKPATCGPPDDLPQGFPNGFSFYHGGHIQYQCFPGFKLHGNPSRRCLANGSWSGSSPSCLPCRCSTPLIQHGTVNATDVACGKTVQIECFRGFKLLGLSEVTCDTNGQWSGLPLCEHADCGSLPVIPNAVVSESSPLEDNVVTYSCRSGYIIQGSSNLICTEKGTWSQPYPACEPLSCGPPPPVANAVATGETYTYESKVKLRCLEGYVIDTDTDTFTCEQDGHWVPERISCSPRKCPVPSNTTRMRVHGDDFRVNKQVSISCAEGFTAEGADSSTCQPNGTWEPPFSDESCTPVSCGHPESPEHGLVVGSLYSFGSIVTYQCDSGYELEGNRERVCQENGQWSGQVALCTENRCEAPAEFLNGKAVLDNTTSGPSLLFSCHRGYTLEGSPEAHCTENGTWSHLVPLCKRQTRALSLL
ncbi:hypothetical protein ACRRTK_021493 [Alexandromys fortis]